MPLDAELLEAKMREISSAKVKEVSAFDKLVNNSTEDNASILMPSPAAPPPKRTPKKKVARAASLPQFKVSKVILMNIWHGIGRMAKKKCFFHFICQKKPKKKKLGKYLMV